MLCTCDYLLDELELEDKRLLSDHRGLPWIGHICCSNRLSSLLSLLLLRLLLLLLLESDLANVEGELSRTPVPDVVFLLCSFAAPLQTVECIKRAKGKKN